MVFITYRYTDGMYPLVYSSDYENYLLLNALIIKKIKRKERKEKKRKEIVNKPKIKRKIRRKIKKDNILKHEKRR
jgi:hypothetical protein